MDERLQSRWFRTSAISIIAFVGLFAKAAGSQSKSLSPVALSTKDFFSDPTTAQNDINFQSDGCVPSSTAKPELEMGHDDQTVEPFTGEYPPWYKPDQKAYQRSVSGSLDSGGVMFNGHHPASKFNGPVTYDDRDNGQFNQLNMVSGFSLGGDSGWFCASRYDLMFGNDYFFTTAAGLDGSERGNRPKWYTDDSFRYGWSMPQLFIEAGYDDLDVKFGHFYSPIGYEDVPAEHNFFVTRSYAFQYGEPTTQTGLLVSNTVDECWSWSGGVVGGWDTFNADTRAALVAGLTYRADDLGSIAFTLVTGDDSTTNQPGVGPFASRTMYSLVGIADLSSRLTYVLQHDLGVQQNAATIRGVDQAEWYGLNQYLFCRLHDCCTLGARFEWFRDDDGFNVTGLRPGNPLTGNYFAGNFYETSLGLNYRPCTCMTIRPEVRYDWFTPSSRVIGSQNPFDDNTSKNQILYGLDAILHY